MLEWIHEHDERWSFVLLYVGLAVVLSIWLSLFWLVVVVAAHLSLELVRQRHLHSRSYVRKALWEIKLDVALVLMALALSLYMEVILGLVGLQSAARASAMAGSGLRAGSRFAAWQRVLRAILLSADDAAQVTRAAALHASKASGTPIPKELGAQPQPEGGGTAVAAVAVRAPALAVQLSPVSDASRPGNDGWSTGDWFAIGLACASVGAIVAAPLLSDHTISSAASVLVEQLLPIPR